MSLASARHMNAVAEAGCAIGNRGLSQCEGCIELHHVAEGSGHRSDFAVAALCSEHHRGQSGLHGMGTKAFIRLYRLPGESEYGLLVWTNEDLARKRKAA
jgi:hypothetical protein